VNDIEILVQPPGRRHITCNPDTLGFRATKTEGWKRLIVLLKNPSGTLFYNNKQVSEKAAWLRINKKLVIYLKSKFDLNIPDGFKLFELVEGKQGTRKPIFQVGPTQVEEDVPDYSNYSQEEILEEIRELSRYNDLKLTDRLKKAADHAAALGIPDSTITFVLEAEDEPSRSDIESLCEEQVSPDIYAEGEEHAFDGDETEDDYLPADSDYPRELDFPK